MSEDKVINELTKIKGLNKKAAIKIYRAGIKSIKKLGSSNPEDLSKITGIAKKQLTTWIILARAQERKKFIEVDTAAAELSQLIEIKLEDAKRLVGSGVMSVEDLAEESPDLLAEDTGLANDIIQKWIKKAKEVKKIPPDKRKVVVVPSVDVSFGSKMSGAFFGSGTGLTNIYNDSSSFGQSLIFVLIPSILLFFYLGVSTNETLLTLWEYTQWSIALGTLTLYPLVIVGGIVIVIAGWLILGKIIASSRHLEFKGASAVLGFAMAPGIFFVIAVVGKWAINPIIAADMKLWLLPSILGIFTAWVAITFIRGLAFSPKAQQIAAVTPSAPKAAAPARATTETTLEVVEEAKPGVTKPSTPAKKIGPVKLSNFGIITQEELTALEKAGFLTSIDLLRANSNDISKKTKIPQSKIIIWRIVSDLLRIEGMDLQYGMILAKSGVRSVKHLAKINENALKVQVLDTISKENITTSITANMLSDWIQKAKTI